MDPRAVRAVTAAVDTTGLWCENFDADLLAVVPGAVEALGDAAGVELWTYSHVTNGRINHPAAWNTDHGLAAFFSTRDRSPTPARYVTRDPLVECTFLEAVRDEWIHSCTIVVNGRVVWRPPIRAFEQLMFDVRDWKTLADEARQRIRRAVTDSLADAALQLRHAIGAAS